MQNPGTKHILLLVLFAALLVLLGAKYLSFRSSPEYRFTVSIQGLQSCILQKDAPQCARPYIADMLETKSGEEIMHGLTDEVGRKYCHFVGHIVGQESYKKMKDVEATIAQCDRACESACIHGVIGQTFADKLGYADDPDDLAHLSESQVRDVGRELCTANQTCHGVGHAIFQMYHDIPRSLGLCTEVSSDSQRAFCTVGVFMEYADVLEVRSAKPGGNVAAPSEAALPAFCTGFPILNDRRACFQYLPTIARAVYWGDARTALAHVEEICGSYRGDDRAACFYGIGAFQNTYLLETEPERVRANCIKYPEFADQAACNYGSFIIDMAIRQPAAFGFCKILDGDFRAACYQNAFNALEKRDAPVAEARDTYCADDPICLRAAKDYQQNPYDYIYQLAALHK